ncbi:MAG: LptF/LptG family permease [Chitinophagaceae bacterium]|nr:LptF/LptG family permease [Chitinophagaceae bacterium]
MKKLDWYILKNFLFTFFYSVLLFTVITVVIDTSEKTDDFVKSGLSYKEIWRQYYSGFVPHIVSILFPLFVFIAVIFFTSKLANRSEFIAILAGGVSLKRMLVPYFAGGIFLALLLWVGNLYFVPRANVKRAAFETKYVNGPSLNFQSSGIYMQVDSFSYCGIRYYDTTSKSGGSFFMETVRNNNVVYNLRADNIMWDTAAKNWKLSGVIERRINGLKEEVTYEQSINRKFNFLPQDLRDDDYIKDRLTSPELKRMIELARLRGTESVKELSMEQHRRNATPASVVILTLIGAVIACRKIRGGSGIHLAAGLCISAIYIVSDRFSTIFSTKGDLHPFIAAWLPNVVFALVAFYLYKKAPK